MKEMFCAGGECVCDGKMCLEEKRAHGRGMAKGYLVK